MLREYHRSPRIAPGTRLPADAFSVHVSVSFVDPAISTP